MVGCKMGPRMVVAVILGVAAFLSGALVSPLVGLGGTMTAVPMAIVMVLGAVGAQVMHHRTKR